MKFNLDEIEQQWFLIAYQLDRNHTNAQIQEINNQIVEEFIINTEKIVIAITSVVKKKRVTKSIL